MTDTTETPPPPPQAPVPGGSGDGTGPADEARAPEPEGEKATSPVRLAVIVALIGALGVFGGVSILIVVLAIIVMIFLHELGHYLTAKAAGMKVTEFFIGFGPTLWAFRRGETAYGVKAIPAGAYVKIIGMHNLEEVDPADEGRTYRQKSYWRRMSVAVAGSTMHFLIALVCIFVLLVGLGLPGGTLLPDPSAWQVGAVSEGSAADEAGLQDGDRILGADGQSFESFEDLGDYVSARPEEALAFTVVRDGETFTREITVGEEERGGETIGLLGVTNGLPDEETVNPVVGVGRTFIGFGEITVASVQALGNFLSPSGLSDFGSQLANAGDSPAPPPGEDGGSAPAGGDGPVEGENRVISISGATLLGAQLTETGVAGLLLFLISINVFIGIFNLVPLLPLDGGHVGIATYERIRELVARKRTRYFADVAKLLPLTYLVVVLMVGLFVSTLYLDIVNPLDLG